MILLTILIILLLIVVGVFVYMQIKDLITLNKQQFERRKEILKPYLPLILNNITEYNYFLCHIMKRLDLKDLIPVLKDACLKDLPKSKNFKVEDKYLWFSYKKDGLQKSSHEIRIEVIESLIKKYK